MQVPNDVKQAARKLDGLYTGSMPPEEYELYIQLGLLRQDFAGIAGLMGLSKLRYTGGK